MKTIVIGCDNAALAMKRVVKDLLIRSGYDIEDVGCDDETDPTVYPEIARMACLKIQQSGFEKKGILICGTGIGMAMTANKFKGIRAAVTHDSFSAERSVLSNNANVLCMGERVIGMELAKKIISEWLTQIFVDGSSTPKLAAIKAIEDANFA